MHNESCSQKSRNFPKKLQFCVVGDINTGNNMIMGAIRCYQSGVNFSMTTKLHETEGQKKSCCYFYLQTWHYQHCWSQQYAGSEGLRFDSLWRLGIFSLSHAHEKTNTSFSMLIIVNNLHEKCIAESQEWRNFGSVHAICNFHLSYMKNALVFSQSDMCNFCIYIITTQR